MRRFHFAMFAPLMTPCNTSVFLPYCKPHLPQVASSRAVPTRPNERLTFALTLKNSAPTPALRSMKSPFTTGRPAVPRTVVTPDVMLNGGAE